MQELSNSSKLILQNMGLIKKCVSQINSLTYEFDDLVQEAVAILLPKMEKFNPSKGSLSTFIWQNIKHELINSTQELSEHYYKKSVKFKKAENYLAEKGEETSAENMAKFLGVKVSTYQAYVDQFNSVKFVNLDACYSDDDEKSSIGSNLADTKYASPEDALISNSMRHVLSKAVNSLPENQRQVIILHYNLNNSTEGCFSFRQIAKLLDINHQTAANYAERGLETLRNQLGDWAA